MIDNGSTDGTAEYLAGIRDAGRVPVTVITNAENRGFAAAVNQGLNAARGRYLVLLNNDTVVTEGWLEGLIAATAESDTEGGAPVGMVGPMSNYVTPPQMVEQTAYQTLEEMHKFAGRWSREHRGGRMAANKLSGFCLLLTRAVYDAVGGLDERFGLGFFEDDDLTLHVRKAGFGLVVAQDVFVHHYGSRTMSGNGVDSEALMQANMQRLQEKWPEIEVRRGQTVYQAKQGVQESMSKKPKEKNVASGAGKAKVSLTMIVRNEEHNLPHCLESVRGLFDEIVVVDTGSTDRTKEIAAGFGANVVEFAWIDDFAAARNVALGNATGDYAFWLDADDVVEPPERIKLEEL